MQQLFGREPIAPVHGAGPLLNQLPAVGDGSGNRGPAFPRAAAGAAKHERDGQSDRQGTEQTGWLARRQCRGPRHASGPAEQAEWRGKSHDSFVAAPTGVRAARSDRGSLRGQQGRCGETMTRGEKQGVDVTKSPQIRQDRPFFPISRSSAVP